MRPSTENTVPGGGGFRALGSAILLATTLSATAAAAEPLRAEVSVHGSADEVQGLEATLRGLFPAAVQLRVNAVDAVDGAKVMRESITLSTDDVAARAWIELHDGASVTIYVADVSGERILVRHLPRSDQDPELVREATARVVATALEALLSGAEIGVERAKLKAELEEPPPAPPPPPAAPPPPPPAAKPSAFAATLGAHYGLELFSSEVPVVHGPGLSVGLNDTAHSIRPGAQLVGQLWLPSRASGEAANVRIYTGALRLLATLEHRFSELVALNAGLGGGVDFTRVEPGAADTQLTVRLAAPQTLATPALRAALGARFRHSFGLSLYTTLALDADPSRTRYVSVDAGATSRLLAPHTLRPSLVVGVATP
jgi:hypothetical protein